MWALQDLKLTTFENHFILSDGEVEYFFSTDNNLYHPYGVELFNIDDNLFDKKIIASSKFIDYDKDEYDFMIYSNLDEPFHDINSENTLKFLDDGNVILSATYSDKVSHKNLISDYRFNFYYFYHDKGFNFLNYYNFTEKDSLFGIYEKESSSRYSTKNNSLLYNIVKDMVGNELMDFSYKDYPLKKLISYQPRDNEVSFGLWKTNYISSYLDMSRCVVFYTREAFLPNDSLYGYITEKTLKCLLFSKSNIFSIWHGSEVAYQKLSEYGFWFLNSEFYKNDIVESVKNATDYCLELKSSLGTNENVFNHLNEKYKDRLDNNFKIMNDILFNCPLKNEIKACINKK